jgi:hypothetical protein
MLSGMCAGVLIAANVSCASQAQRAAYDGFLDQIAKECKPLIIGSDNFGLALMAQGTGADPDNYTTFLSQTKALYNGSIPPAVYRNALTAFLGPGSYNDRSFDCIVAHLPKN